ncbi:MAG: hypothetical protein OHK005_07120 [Candidatus Methylacidiphilales bacterium]
MFNGVFGLPSRTPLLASVLFTLSYHLHANDGLFLETTAFGGAVTRTWTTPQAQRTEVTADPGSEFAKMMTDIGGEAPQVRIVRLDRGVVWTLNAAEKTYSEEPLALPYEPVSTGDLPEPEPEDPSAKPPPLELKEAKQKRSFAGFEATGFELWGDAKRLGTLWVAPLQGSLAQCHATMENFHQAETTARFKGWPEKDRLLFQGEPDLLAATPVAGTLWGGAAARFDQLRNTFILALQAGDDEPGLTPDTLVMQVRAVRMEPISPSLFDLPEGYKKIEGEPEH